MKTIEKTTRDGDIQIFEIITSRNELRSWFHTNLSDSLYSEYATGIWEDEDSSVDWCDRDGNYWGTELGGEVKRPNLDFITKMVSNNCSTTVIYGDVEIIYNEYHGDWETNFGC